MSLENQLEQYLLEIYSYKTLVEDYGLNSNKIVDAYLIYKFEKELSCLILKNCLYVEHFFKIALSNFIDKYISEQEVDYLNSNNYSKNHRNKCKLNQIIKELESQKNTNQELKTIIKINNNNLPSRVAMDYLTFGQLFNWYKILKNDDKKHVIRQFFPNFQVENSDFVKVLERVYKLRNSTAHSDNLFELKVKKCILTNGISNNLGIHQCLSEGKKFHGDDLFTSIVCTILLLRDPLSVNQFIDELTNFFIENENISNINMFDFFNIPHDMPNRLNKLKK